MRRRTDRAPQRDARKIVRRIFYGFVCLFVCAGVTSIAVFMGGLLPAQYKVQASSVCAPMLKGAQVGDCIFFGSYEQDNDLTDGAEAIGWYVLEKTSDSLLLMSCYVLDCVQFNNADAFATWDQSTILRWLNDTFYNTAFSGAEKMLVCPSEIGVDHNPYFDTDPGEKTTEKVFLLSISETTKYLWTDAMRQGRPTAYAIAKGVRVGAQGNCMWWLRTPGYDASSSTRMLSDGTINYCGYRVHSDFNGVRPCIRVSLQVDAA